MLTPQEEDAIRALLADGPQFNGDEERRLRTVLGRDAELQALLNETRVIGSASLLRRLFVKVLDDTTTVATLNFALVTVEEIEEHTGVFPFYVAQVTTATASRIINQGYPHNGVSSIFVDGQFYWNLFTDKATAPNRIRTFLNLVNRYGSDVTVFYKVYRIAGLA